MGIGFLVMLIMYMILVLPKEGTSHQLALVDTVPINNGYFEFYGKVKHPQGGLLSVIDGNFRKEIYVENSDIGVNLFSSKTSCSFKNVWLMERVWGVNFWGYVNGSKALDEYLMFRDEVCKMEYDEISVWLKILIRVRKQHQRISLHYMRLKLKGKQLMVQVLLVSSIRIERGIYNW